MEQGDFWGSLTPMSPRGEPKTWYGVRSDFWDGMRRFLGFPDPPFPQGRAQDVVRGPVVRGRAPGGGDEETDAGAVREPARPPAPARHPDEPQHPDGPRRPRELGVSLSPCQALSQARCELRCVPSGGEDQPMRRRVRHHLPPRLPQRLQPGVQLCRGCQLLHGRLGELWGLQNTRGGQKIYLGRCKNIWEIEGINKKILGGMRKKRSSGRTVKSEGVKGTAGGDLKIRGGQKYTWRGIEISGGLKE